PALSAAPVLSFTERNRKEPSFMGMNPKMLQQLQQMQNKMLKAQEELQNSTYEGTSGGGAVRVTMTGKFEVTAVKLDQEVVDPEDVSLLEDLILTALQDAFNQVTDATAKSMSAAMGGMKLPPGFGF
ncbi:MAG: YbaB/EbfC family nucleoid-associated protein, partial [Ktedonobacterales bacterium]